MILIRTINKHVIHVHTHHTYTYDAHTHDILVHTAYILIYSVICLDGGTYKERHTHHGPKNQHNGEVDKEDHRQCYAVGLRVDHHPENHAYYQRLQQTVDSKPPANHVSKNKTIICTSAVKKELQPFVSKTCITGPCL